MILGNGYQMAPALPAGGRQVISTNQYYPYPAEFEERRASPERPAERGMLRQTAAELREKADAGIALTPAELEVVYTDAGIKYPPISTGVGRDITVAVISGVLIAVLTAILLKGR